MGKIEEVMANISHMRGEKEPAEIINELNRFIAERCGGVIRLFIADSDSTGHQTNGINILKSLLRYNRGALLEMELLYEPGAQERNKNILKELLPEWDGQAECIQLNGDDEFSGEYQVKVSFYVIAQIKHMEKRHFGITGGYDDSSKNLAEYANTAAFLVLQPYQWLVSNAIWLDKLNYRLFQEDDKYKAFAANLAYALKKEITITEDRDTLIRDVGGDEGKADVILKVKQKVLGKEMHMLPVYGITNQNAVENGCQPRDILLHMILGIASAAEAAGKPSVILVMHKTEGIRDKLEEVIKPPKSPQNELENRICEKIAGIIQDRVQIFHYHDLNGKINTLEEKGKISVIFMERLPQNIFNYLYDIADLPVIFEGKGTLTTVLNFGKPYLVLNNKYNNIARQRFHWRNGTKRSGALWNIEFYPVNSEDGAMEESIYQCTKKLQTKYEITEEYEGSLDIIAENLGTYIGNILNSESEQSRYFQKLGEIYNDISNDKLLVGLAEAIRVINSGGYQVKRRLPEDKVEEIYRSMVEHTRDGVLFLFPDAVSEEHIGNIYYSVLGLETVAIEDVTITKYLEDSRIIVGGKLRAYETLLDAEIEFHIKDTVTETASAFLFPGSSGGFQNFGLFSFQDFRIQVTSSSLPLSENVWAGGTVNFGEKLELGFGFDYPVIEDRMVITGFFREKKLAIDSLFGFLGEINLADLLPSRFSEVTEIGIEEITVKYNYKTCTIYEADITASLDFSWKLLPKLEFKEIKLLFGIFAPASGRDRNYYAVLTGDFTLGGGDDTAVLSASVSLPDAAVLVELTDGRAALGDIVTLFLEQSIDLGAYLSDFSMEINSNDSTYSLAAGIEADEWRIKFTDSFSLALTNLSLHIEGGGGNTSGGISGTMHIGKEDGGIDLLVLAEFGQLEKEYLFQAALGNQEQIDLMDLAESFLKALGGSGSVPDWVAESQLQVGGLGFSAFVSEHRKNYEVNGSVLWDLKYHSVSFSRMNADVELGYDSENGTYGSVTGETSLLGMDIRAGFTFGGTDKSLFIEWLGMQGSYEICEEEEFITFAVKKKSLGEIISSLVSVFDSSFRLAPPWDFLNGLNLDGFSVIYHLESKEIEVTYSHQIDLGFLCFEAVTLVKNNQGVFLKAAGTFLGLPVEEGDSGLAEGRDIKDLPEIPGQGNEIFRLAYLGLGQHVALYPAKDISGMEEAVEALSSCFQEPAPVKGGEPPLLPVPVKPEKEPVQPVLIWDGDSKWLIGAKFILLNSIEIGIIFHDPSLYGLMVRISGKKMKIFDGLKFEILYKKISDTVGVYQMELQLPEYMRHLEFGAVSVTLPVIALEIYTNGNFRVDFGFPKNLDFSKSFTIQAFPFSGSGGFYFAMLSSETSEKVPQTRNGSFQPVIEFGMGLSLGVGKDVSAGILKAGLSLTLVGILEGILGFYHPMQPDGPGKDEIYYHIQGTLGITGKIYGEINFAIIYARVDITFYAYIQITMEAYNSIPVSVEAGISVSLTVKINLGLFKIKVSLSFSTDIKASFVIGKDERALAPWNDKKDILFAQNTLQPEYTLVFQPLLAGENKKTLHLYFMPHLTLTEEGETSRAAYAASLYLPKEDAGELIKGIFLWCVNACIHSDRKETTVEEALNGTVTREQLQYISQRLSESGNLLKYRAEDGRDISTFIENYFHIELLEPGDEAGLEAGVFPVFPDFNMQLFYNGSTQVIEFGSYHLCGGVYMERVQALIRKMAVDIEGRENSAGRSAVREGELLSMSELIFADYVGMIAGNILQTALEVCKKEQQVRELAEQFTGEDISQILGMTARFMLGGLSLPSVQEPGKEDFLPLYELTGQLFELPQLHTGDDYEIMLSASEKQGNISFGSGQENGESVVIKLEDSEIARIQNLQTLSLTPVLLREPRAAAAYKDIARVYSLEKRLRWDKMIYMLPVPLQLLLKENPGTPVTLYSSEDGEISSYTMAVLLNLEIRTMGQTPGNAYETVGTDEQGIETLQKLLKYIKGQGSSFIQEIYFLYYPDKKEDRLIACRPEEMKAAIVKTNLSTESNPVNGILKRKAAVLNPVEEFLEQLWEASIVRTGGFYLYYRAPEPFPSSIFDEYGSGTIKLLITCEGKTEEFINCVIPEKDMPGEQESFFILLPEVTERRAVIPQGCAGITCIRKNPGEYTPVEPYPVPATPESILQDKIYLENQFQLMGYRILEDEIFSQVESLSPVGPADGEEARGDWTYDFVVPLAKHVKGAKNDNPYSGIGETARIALEWKDIFGCRMGSRAAAYTVSFPLLYTDSLIAFSKWTGVTADYCFAAADKTQICFRFHYDSSRYTSGQKPEELQQCLNYAQMDLLLYQKIGYQLEQDTAAVSMHNSLYMAEDGSGYADIAVDKQFFIEFVFHIREFLKNCVWYLEAAIGGNPGREYFCKMKELLEKMEEISAFTSEIQENNPDDVFALTTEVIIKRTGYVHEDFKEAEGVFSVANVIMPYAEKQQDTGAYSFRIFAEGFEEIFKDETGMFLKLAEGISEEGKQELWVVRFHDSGKGRGISCILSDEKYYFAPRPLSTKLLNLSDLEITEYVSGQEFVLGAKTVRRSFYNADMDTWANTLLEAVDFILSPDFAVPLYLCDNGELLKKICENKKTIAECIASSMTNIMEEDKAETECLEMVREKMKQRLLIRLGDAYTVSTVAAAAVETGTEDREEKYPAKLYGSIQRPGNRETEYSYKFSNAKVPVKCGKTWLTTLFEVNGQDRQRNFSFENLQYTITHMEHKIEKLFADSSYLASKWLTFLIPLNLQRDMGKMDIPLPLREYPQAPSVLSQEYQYLPEEGTELSKARAYNYIFTYHPVRAAQDTIKLWVYFNVEEQGNTLRNSRGNSLPSALAQFISVYPDIKNDLIKYLAGNEQPDQKAVNAAKALQAALSLVAESWGEKKYPGKKAVLQEVYKFDITELSEEQGNPQSRLIVQVADSDGTDFPLPLIFIEGYRTENIVGQDGAYAFYKMQEEEKVYLTYGESMGIKERKACFLQLDILKKQNVWAGVYVERNGHLIAGKQTNPEFIYQTNLMKFGSKLVPLLQNKCEINMGDIGRTGEKRTLEEHLRVFMKELLKDSGLAVFSLKISCSYAYRLYKDREPLTLPMYLTVPYPAGENKKTDGENGLIQQLADKISGWFTRYHPEKEEGKLQFRVELYADGSNHMPFLVLENVILMAEDIEEMNC